MPNKAKLSTIMFTDIVGYSSMISRDETHALNLLSMHDKIIEPILAKHDGLIIKKIGDAIFAEFKTSQDSVEAAKTIQHELKNRNEIMQAKDKIEIRIGLHVGNVIRKDNDLFGHDVNLCSRIESAAPTGGIAASHALIKQIKYPDQYPNREMGYVKFKNIPTPQQVYKVYLDHESYDQETDKILHQNLIENGINIVDIDTYEIKKTYSAALLYIKNLGTEEDETINYNLTENIITDIEFINELRTPSLNSILQYKDTDLGPDDLGRILKVDHIILGTMLRKDNGLRLTFELIDLNSGKKIWSESWTDLITNNKKIRKKILDGIINSFDCVMPEQLIELYSEEITTNNEALEIYYKGKYLSNTMPSKDALEEAKSKLEYSIKIDQKFVEAYSEYALVCQRLGHYDDAESSLAIGEKIASKKNDQQGLASIYNVFNLIFSERGQYNKALDYIKKALKIQIRLNNNLKEAKFRLNYANLLNHILKPELSIEQNKQAISIIENIEDEQLLGVSLTILANTYYGSGKFSESISNGKKALGIFRNQGLKNYESRILVIIADTYSKIGDFINMTKYVEQASPIVDSFDDYFLQGKLEYFKSQNAIFQNDIPAAIDHIDASIDQYELAETRPFVINNMIEKVKLFIETNKQKKAANLLSKIELQLKKMKNPSLSHLINAIKYLLEIDSVSSAKNEIEKIALTLYKAPEDSISIENQIFSFWYLARACFGGELLELASDYHARSKELIHKLEENISDEDDRYFFNNNLYYYNKIKEDLKEADIKIDAKIESGEKPVFFKFCPKCGQNNDDQFAFCPGCGNSLQLT